MDFISEFLAENPALVVLYHILKWVLIVLNFVFLAIMIYALGKLSRYTPRFVYDPRKWQKHVKRKKNVVADLRTPAIVSAWAKVRSKTSEDSADSMRLAVIEADGVAGEVLRKMDLPGKTFADRLDHLKPEKYPSVNNLWDAHRLRNNLVHTPDFKVSAAKAEEAIAAYEAFLKETKAL